MSGGAVGRGVELTVATWNLGGRRNLRRYERELTETPLGTSDVLCFQEIPTGKRYDAAALLAERFGYPHVQAYRWRAILSRWPLVAGGYVTINPDTNRHAPWADLAAPGANGEAVVRVYGPHLTYKRKRGWPFEDAIRTAEMEHLLAHAEGFPGAVVVAGDLNTVGRMFLGGHGREGAVRLLREAGFTDALAAHPGGTHMAIGRLDWIWMRGAEGVASHRGRLAGSDHRWLQARLRIQG